MSTLHDLHSHSTASDGALRPPDLIARAAAAGVTVLALTDHDTLDGLPGATAAAADLGLSLIPGVEISVTWSGQTVHILGLRVNPDDAALNQGLVGLQAFRDWRAEEIGRRLARAGVSAALDGARRFAQGRIIGRTHFARHLVASGHSPDLRTVFKRWLTQGKPGHVPGEWASLEQAIAWIRGAGGIAVIAHPARYRMTSAKLRRLIEQFQALGGEGIEVVSGSHSRDDIVSIAGVARRHRLLASAGSDFHDPENPWVELGQLPTLPEGLEPVWSRWEQAG